MPDDARTRFDPRNAGGTAGGAGQFFLGLGLMAAGAYLFLQSVQVTTGFSFGMPLFGIYGRGVSGGMLLILLCVGVAMIFYNGSSFLGWVLAVGSLLLLSIGIVTSLHFVLAGVSLFELLCVLGMFAAGLGLFLRSLRPGA